jgi:hypothetical protein
MATMVFMPLPVISGSKTGSLLEPGGKALNFVMFETPSGDTTPAIVLLSNTNIHRDIILCYYHT